MHASGADHVPKAAISTFSLRRFDELSTSSQRRVLANSRGSSSDIATMASSCIYRRGGQTVVARPRRRVRYFTMADQMRVKSRLGVTGG
jgi:hypothetical protein